MTRTQLQTKLIGLAATGSLAQKAELIWELLNTFTPEPKREVSK